MFVHSVVYGNEQGSFSLIEVWAGRNCCLLCCVIFTDRCQGVAILVFLPYRLVVRLGKKSRLVAYPSLYAYNVHYHSLLLLHTENMIKVAATCKGHCAMSESSNFGSSSWLLAAAAT